MTDDALVLVDRPVDGVAVVTLNRPAALNALNFALMGELVAALERARRRRIGVRAIVLRGSGERAFAAGADIKEMAGATPDVAVRERTRSRAGRRSSGSGPRSSRPSVATPWAAAASSR